MRRLIAVCLGLTVLVVAAGFARAEATYGLSLFGELKYGPARFVRLYPQPTTVTANDGPADRQTHPYTGRFCGEEGLENSLNIRRINAGA